MRTTLEIDDDLVATARQIARQKGQTLGEVVSSLARRSLDSEPAVKLRNGVPLFAPTGRSKPTLRTVNDLRDDG
jgi:hypothetical protein